MGLEPMTANLVGRCSSPTELLAHTPDYSAMIETLTREQESDIDIAVITPSAFQWVQRKRWSIKE